MKPSNKSDSAFAERLNPSLSGLAPLLLIVPAVWLVALPIFNSSIGFVLGACVVVLIVALRFAVAKRTIALNDQLILGSTVIPLRHVKTVETLTKSEIREAMGPKLDARSVLHFSNSANYLIRVSFEDNTLPDLLVSTNAPEQLTNAIRSAK